MRKRRSKEDLQAVNEPTMYQLADLKFPATLRSSFPSWRGSTKFDYRNGWTKMDDFFADGYFTRDEMRELVRVRFGVVIQ